MVKCFLYKHKNSSLISRMHVKKKKKLGVVLCTHNLSPRGTRGSLGLASQAAKSNEQAPGQRETLSSNKMDDI